jgi:uncharacterized membrane-anchored protein
MESAVVVLGAVLVVVLAVSWKIRRIRRRRWFGKVLGRLRVLVVGL